MRTLGLPLLLPLFFHFVTAQTDNFGAKCPYGCNQFYGGTINAVGCTCGVGYYCDESTTAANGGECLVNQKSSVCTLGAVAKTL